jgi:uncharacterized protein (TIGR00251 family)
LQGDAGKKEGLDIREENDAVVFKIFVLPKSSRNMVCGEHDGALKIKLTAAPVENAANKLCISYLSKCLDFSKSSMEIAAGHTGRNKQIRVKCSGKADKAAEKNEIRSRIEGLLRDVS